MFRAHRIPIVGLVLSVACNRHPGDSSTTGESDDSESDSVVTTGPGCVGPLGDASQLPAPTNECGHGTCPPGEICVQRLACHFLRDLCGDEEDVCYFEQDPTYCLPIPEECETDADGLKACLEQMNGLCQLGGEYSDGYLECTYAFDQCNHAESFFTPYCQDLSP